ncbi:hypothetical protein [Photobacterium piscicola]|uniref:hypothetical protein n=1 Tax=Photobacterium piscicola TaxID=1378299 RepID=UPI00373640C5
MMNCISNFLEVMDHEFPNNMETTVPYTGYKVDGNGIKKHCLLNTLKSVDYYSLHPKHGFLYVEFSDLIRQDEEIKNKAERISNSNLSSHDKRNLKKECFKIINKELVLKYKDSFLIKQIMVNKLNNIPAFFEGESMYVIVVAPIEKDLSQDKKIEIIKFIDTLKDKISASLPKDLFTQVKVITLDRFIA